MSDHYQTLCENGHLNYRREKQLNQPCFDCDSKIIWAHEFETSKQGLHLEIIKDEVEDSCPTCGQDYIKEKTIFKIPEGS